MVSSKLTKHRRFLQKKLIQIYFVLIILKKYLFLFIQKILIWYDLF